MLSTSAVLRLALALGATACAATGRTASDPLRGRAIVVDPGHGGTAATDSYRVGPGGEREEWVNLRVALILKELLEARGARVLLTRDADTDVPLKARADLARDSAADAFISIHHNATADPAVNFPIIYYHAYASVNEAGVKLARHLALHLTDALFDGKAEPSVVSDHVIFAGSGTAVLRHSYGIPGVIAEASFFTNPEEERRLRDPAWNRREAEAYVRALSDFFSGPAPPIYPKESVPPLEPFRTAQEAERMSDEARRWREDFEEGQRLLEGPGRDLERAFELLTRSARNFPDSPVAREAHLLRADILDAWGRTDEAGEVRRRVREFYSGAVTWERAAPFGMARPQQRCLAIAANRRNLVEDALLPSPAREASMPSRRSVLTRLGVLSAAVALRPDSAFATTAPSAGNRWRGADDWDLGWLDDLKGKHRQVFDCGTFTDEETPTHVVANWLDAHKEVFGLEHPQVNAIMGIAFNAFPLNAGDALWKKYSLGEMWKIHDRGTDQWAERHTLYEPPADLPDDPRARRFARMTVKSLQSRGTIFWQCNNALIGIAHMLGEGTRQPWEAVYDELKAGLVPGVRLVPAHTLLIGLVQERGCTYEKV